MMLTQLKDFFKQRHIVSFFDLTLQFKIDHQVLRDMLQLWVNKGKIRKISKTDHCGTKCTKCHPFVREIYEWVE
jgi:hypothetical protein